MVRSRSGLLARGPSVVSLPTRIRAVARLCNAPFPHTAAGPRRLLTGFPRAETVSTISHGRNFLSREIDPIMVAGPVPSQSQSGENGPATSPWERESLPKLNGAAAMNSGGVNDRRVNATA